MNKLQSGFVPVGHTVATRKTTNLPSAEITETSCLLLLFLLPTYTISTCQAHTTKSRRLPSRRCILLRRQVFSDRYFLFFSAFPLGVPVFEISAQPSCPILFTFRLFRCTLGQGFFRLVLSSQLCLQAFVVNLERILDAVARGLACYRDLGTDATHTVIPRILTSSRGRSVPLWLGSDSMAERTVSLSINFPKTVCLPLRCGVARNVKKNWLL